MGWRAISAVWSRSNWNLKMKICHHNQNTMTYFGSKFQRNPPIHWFYIEFNVRSPAFTAIPSSTSNEKRNVRQVIRLIFHWRNPSLLRPEYGRLSSQSRLDEIFRTNRPPCEFHSIQMNNKLEIGLSASSRLFFIRQPMKYSGEALPLQSNSFFFKLPAHLNLKFWQRFLIHQKRLNLIEF